MRFRLLVPVLLLGACAPQDPACPAASTRDRLYQITALTLPQTHADFAYDLNGDGRPENQLGAIIEAMAAADFGAQEYVDASLANGSDVMQVEVFVDDAGHAAATYGQVMGGLRAGLFCGGDALHFDSTPTAEMHESTDLDFTLSFADGVSVSVRGAHLQFTTTGDTIQGELHGAVPANQINTVVDQGIADLMSKKVKDPNYDPTQLLLIFDKGDNTGGSCTNFDGTRSDPDDGVIGPCEILLNSVTKNVLAPDVDLFDFDGHFAPRPNNDYKDSLSLGIGFTARAQ